MKDNCEYYRLDCKCTDKCEFDKMEDEKVMSAEEMISEHKALEELEEIPNQFPLIAEMRKRKEAERNKYYARINYNLMVHGTTKLVFDDIDYESPLIRL